MTKLLIEQYKAEINNISAPLAELKKKRLYAEVTALKYQLAKCIDNCPPAIHAAAYATDNHLKHVVVGYINVLICANKATQLHQSVNVTHIAAAFARLDSLFQANADSILLLLPYYLLEKFIEYCAQFAEYYPHTQRIVDKIKQPSLTEERNSPVIVTADSDPASEDEKGNQNDPESDHESDHESDDEAAILVAPRAAQASNRYGLFKSAAVGAGLFYLAGSGLVAGGLAGAAASVTINTLSRCCRRS